MTPLRNVVSQAEPGTVHKTHYIYICIYVCIHQMKNCWLQNALAHTGYQWHQIPMERERERERKRARERESTSQHDFLCFQKIYVVAPTVTGQ